MIRNKAVLLMICAVLPLAGQAPPAGPGAQQSLGKGVVRKNLAPVSKDILQVKLPKPAERKLKNGLPLLVIENHKLPTVFLHLILPAGNLSEPAESRGLAEATAEMLRQGTKTMSAREIAEKLSELGATMNIYSEYGGRSTHLVSTVLSENLDPLLDLVSDVLLNPAFPEEELTKWKARRGSQLQQMRSMEMFLADERLRNVLYPNDARRVNAPTAESLKNITRDQILAYYKANYRPGSSLMGVTGDISSAALVEKLDKRLGGWESGTVTGPKLAIDAPISEKKIILVNRPNSVQTYLQLANRAMERTSPDYIAVEVMNRILGGGPAGRLFITLREEKGFTYGAYSSLASTNYLHHFAASASVRTDVTGPAIEAFLDEFKKIREQAVSAEDLDNAKRALVANFALGLESQAGMLRQLLMLREYGLPTDYWDTFPAKVMAITAADVQRVARKYVPFENVQLIAVGDATKIRDVVKKYGPVEEYSTEGVRVTN